LTRARTTPIVRTTRPSRHFCAAKTCSTRARTQGTGGVTAADVHRHLFAARLFALELRFETAALEQHQVGRRAVGDVGPDIADGVVAVEHRAELAAIIGRGVGDGVAPQKPKRAVDPDMVL
jgi:hypothetical protein